VDRRRSDCRSVSASQLWKWSIRETRFLLYSAAISILYLLVTFIPFTIFKDIAALFEHAAVIVQVVLLVAGSIAVLAAGGYICGRLLLILPATAIDRRPTSDWMDWALAQSKGNEWPLTIFFLIPVPLTMALNPINRSVGQFAREVPVLVAIGMVMLMCALICIATIIEGGILSIAFKTLVPMLGAGQEPSEEVTVSSSQ
jgi:hypothetical protein